MTPLDAIAMLEDDHETLLELLGRLEETTVRAVKTRRELLESVSTEVRTHAAIEEQIFYPAYKEATLKKEEREMYFEALEEHHVVHLLLPELERADVETEEFGAKVKVFREILEHHIEEEQNDMFPSARKAMTRGQLVSLADEMAQRKTELMASAK